MRNRTRPDNRFTTDLQGVQPASVQEDGEADEVAVLCHHLCNTTTTTTTNTLRGGHSRTGFSRDNGRFSLGVVRDPAGGRGGSGGRTFHSVFHGELLAVVLEVQDDLGALPDAAGLRDLKHPGAGRARTHYAHT